MNRLNHILALGLASLGIVAGNLHAQFVSVGNVGNANDSTGFGAVGYNYGIGTFEVTLSQYTAFLNAVAKTSDPRGLYNTSMGTDQNVRGISRTTVAGVSTYAVIGSGNRPVSYVSWFDAARYANWLQNGQPVGIQGNGTTDTGAYTLGTATTGTAFPRNPGAIYALPSENEWYKAAYYQPAAQGGDADGYWLYPTRSNVIPNSRSVAGGAGTDPNSANFLFDDGIANGFNGGYAVTQSSTYSTTQNYLMDVGTYSLASSFYGTFDQGGNEREWTEGVFSANNRAVRGGAWNADDANMSAANRNTVLAFSEVESIGFRIVGIPEPSVGAITALGIGMLAWTWKRRRAV